MSHYHTRLTALEVLSELQRACARKEHCDAPMKILRQYAGGGFAVAEYFCTILFKVSHLAKIPSIMPAAK